MFTKHADPVECVSLNVLNRLIESHFMVFVLLITAPGTHPNAWHAYYFARAALAQAHTVKPFFYGDGITVANRLACPAQDELNLAQLWAELAAKYQFELPVCIAAALKRGVTDAENAKRHHLEGENLHPAFTLAGLGTLAEGLIEADRTLSFTS